MTKQQLIEDNMKLVYWLIAREFPTYTQDEDIKQVGMVGLCMAADKWDESKGKFSVFAYSCIRNAILNEFKSRNKHNGVLSLDYELISDNGEKTTFGELIAGEQDVMYLDTCEDQLTPLQKQILGLLLKGVPPKDVAKRLNTTPQNVYWTRRRMRLLREQTERKG